MKVKKLIKRIFITLLSVIVLLAIVIAIALNFVFTPERITPTVTQLLNENLNAKVSCESMELTFFSSFPHFGVKLKKGNVVTPSYHGRKPDTLAHFDVCRASFNALKLYRKHDLVINNLTIINPGIKAVVHKDGNANWNIVKETPADTVSVQDSTAFKIKSILIKKFNVENARVAYHDFVSKTHAKADSLEIHLKASDTKDRMEVATQTSAKHIKFSMDGYRFVKNLKADFTTDIKYDKKKHRIDFDKSTIKLNDIDFITEGHFKRDTVTNEIATDVVLEMKVPSLKTLWEAIPEHIIKKDDIDVHGNVAIKAFAKGVYSKKRLPVFDVLFKIDHGVLKYNKFPGEIRHLEADLHALVNYDKPEQSNLTIKEIYLEGTGVDLKGNATVKNLLKDPEIDSNIKGDLDLTTLKKKFPIAQNITAKGLAHIDINAIFKSNDIIDSKFNNMKLKGNSVFTNLLISDPKDTLYFETKKTELVFGRKAEDNDNRKSFGRIAATNLKLNYKNQHNVDLAGLDVKLKAKMQKDSMPKLAAEIHLTNLKYNGTNKIKAVVRKANATAELSPRSTKARPAINTTFTVDSAGVWQDKKFVGIKNGNYKLTVRKNREDIWMPRGHVEFNNLYAYSPDFALPLRMEHSKIGINNRAITLQNAHIYFGNSDVTLTGQINNMLAKKSPDKKVDATLTLTSNFIDANEIMKVLSPETTPKEQQPDFKQVAENKVHDPKKVTNKKTVFKIPENIKFAFNSDIKKLHYGSLDLRDLKGVLKIEDGHLKLNHFELTTLAARLTASLNYVAVSDRRAKVDFDLDLHDIEMANIAKVMPAMDSLMPMTKSFVGKAHLRMEGNAMLNRKMDVVIPSVTSIAALQATDIMVLDSETFKELAKTLMFKDKENKTIQALNMEMIIEKSHMEILPALVEIDRYRLAVGGIQNLDLTYDYHVSVLKSPIPFKTGVNIKGNLDDYKISLGKAKYKYYFTDKERLKEKADEDIINKKKNILAKLEFE
ncbi:AsmA family protein [Flavobacterium sp. Sd200]|uniref:AsmA family protein n=1 Tax=Flavobacterium sp. Sd200 TaxID=2692211 RepID=UPI001370188D|nr:AsmA family protein [Flavobacterium sp. Sd200]MXN92781.1 AsmA family protein [Flavobacterium sp. Sd200]